MFTMVGKYKNMSYYESNNHDIQENVFKNMGHLSAVFSHIFYKMCEYGNPKVAQKLETIFLI